LTHLGVQADDEQVRPLPQCWSQLEQLFASVAGLTHWLLQTICDGGQVRVTHWLPLQILPGRQSASPQQAKQPVPAQQVRAPPAHGKPELQTPLLQVSVVQELPSLHCPSEQHCWHDAPQSFGVVGAQAQLPAVHSAPLLQAMAQVPQWAASLSMLTSQSAGLLSQLSKPVRHTGLPATQV
jgi:hypothetical protein